jgi:hypothetical protein
VAPDLKALVLLVTSIYVLISCECFWGEYKASWWVTSSITRFVLKFTKLSNLSNKWILRTSNSKDRFSLRGLTRHAARQTLPHLQQKNPYNCIYKSPTFYSKASESIPHLQTPFLHLRLCLQSCTFLSSFSSVVLCAVIMCPVRVEYRNLVFWDVVLLSRKFNITQHNTTQRNTTQQT